MKNIDQLLGIELTIKNPLEIYHPVHGELIYYKDICGFEERREYNSQGNLIFYENSEGFKEWREYDSQGNVNHYKNSCGGESWREYNSRGELIYENIKGKVYLDNRKKSLTKSEIAEKLKISVEDVENAR